MLQSRYQDFKIPIIIFAVIIFCVVAYQFITPGRLLQPDLRAFHEQALSLVVSHIDGAKVLDSRVATHHLADNDKVYVWRADRHQWLWRTNAGQEVYGHTRLVHHRPG